MDDSEFAAVFRAQHDFVWRTLWHFGLDRDCIDDATQDVFVVVHRKLPTFDGRAPIRSWLIGIARNVSARYRYRSERAKARPVPSLVEPVDPEAATLRREAVDIVEAFVERLDEDKRAVFRLCQIEGMSAPEAAEILGVKLNTVYSRLRLARRRFEAEVARHNARAQRRAAWTG